jgi:hypothetical protein
VRIDELVSYTDYRKACDVALAKDDGNYAGAAASTVSL